MKLGNIPAVLGILIAAFAVAYVFSFYLPSNLNQIEASLGMLPEPLGPRELPEPIIRIPLDESEPVVREPREPREVIDITTRTTTTRTTTTTTTTATTATTTETTTTTTSETTTTTTTTTAAPSFTYSNFECHARTGGIAGYDCSLTYNNALGENAAIVFVISDSQQITLSSVVYTAPQGSGTAPNTYFCTSSGNYYMSWQAYRASDTNFQNEVGFSTPAQAQLMSCP